LEANDKVLTFYGRVDYRAPSGAGIVDEVVRCSPQVRISLRGRPALKLCFKKTKVYGGVGVSDARCLKSVEG